MMVVLILCRIILLGCIPFTLNISSPYIILKKLYFTVKIFQLCSIIIAINLSVIYLYGYMSKEM